MLKTKIFNFLADGGGTAEDLNRFFFKRDAHEKEISNFIENLSKEGHTFVSIDSVSYGRFEPNNRIRTIIVYIENPTRKVIVEKKSK